jgi:carbamoyltransferase
LKVLGISPLDKDATASLVEDGRIVFAAGEERYSRRKQHAGFPRLAIEAALDFARTTPEQVDAVAYPFFTAEREAQLIAEALDGERRFHADFQGPDLAALLAAADRRVPARSAAVHGLRDPNQRMAKGLAKRLFYRLAGTSPAISAVVARRMSERWAEQAVAEHRHWQHELEQGLARLGLAGKLRRGEHHFSHAANAYLSSGLDRALIVTIDGYGSGLAGSVSLGEGGRIKRLHGLPFPHSLGTFYEAVTSSLGFRPDRHAGKIVGLAAYGDPAVLSEVLLARIAQTGETFRLAQNLNIFFSRHLATRYPMVDLAAAWQHVLEVVSVKWVAHWVAATGCGHVVLSGGVTANVKLNQRIHALPGVESTFIYPNMGDGGCGTGLALHQTLLRGGHSGTGAAGQDSASAAGAGPHAARPPIRDVYLGPEFTEAEITAALQHAGLPFSRPGNLAAEVARRIHGGEVIGRFDGRMEYGPRALGNRSVLYHARQPEVNQWLNKRLGRTEFMPFAPVTLWEAADRCYLKLDGARHAAEFMTITFDCTPWMREQCPAAVHVDGTARPQLVRREINPGYHAILSEYEKLSGIPTLINTSFNMHEEPIVCSPADAIRAFLLGHLDGLAIGPFYVPNPQRETGQAQPR